MMYRATFSLDNGGEDPVILATGYTDGRMLGGGWACPWISREDAIRILTHFASVVDTAYYEYDEESDTYVLHPDPQFQDREEFVGRDWEVNGEILHLYDFTGWTWYEDEKF